MKKHKKLSIDELRKFPGFENFTEQEGEEAIKTIEALSILFYELFMKCKFHVAIKNEYDHMKVKYENVTHLKIVEDHETEQQQQLAA